MNVKWTPEPAHRKQPDSPHTKIAWTLWAIGAALIVTWIASMAMGANMGGRAHLLLVAFGVLLLISVLLGFRNVEYLEPMRIARRRIARMRIWRWGGKPTATAAHEPPTATRSTKTPEQ